MQRFSADTLLATLSSLPATDHYRVALSGGLDSTVLLHAVAALRGRLSANVSAIHVDHAIHPDSASWAGQCRELCEGLDLPLELHRVEVNREGGEGLEAAARHARYRVFESLLGEGEVLLTAHHRDDQAETLMLQLLRGSGLHGLAAMPVERPLGRGRLARPLLSVARDALQVYAAENGLDWLDDPSNMDTAFERNYLRHELLPLLRRRHPAVDTTLARTAQHLGEALQLLEGMAAEELGRCSDDEGETLVVSRLLALEPAARHNLLRHWLRRRAFPLPSTVLLAQLEHDLLEAREDAVPRLAWPGCELRRYRDRIHAMPPLPSPPATGTTIIWRDGESIELPSGLGLLEGITHEMWSRLEGRRLEVRFRQGGERCRPQGRPHRHALKKLFQEMAVPPWLRVRWPMLYLDGELIALPGLFHCQSGATEASLATAIRWQRPF